MANNGFISSSGIDQIFTTGPYVGSIVTSSFSSGSTLLGPTITFYQAFVSGASEDPNSVESIVPCRDVPEVFERYYFDPINCPTGDCLAPIALSAAPFSCATQTFEYFFFFNSGSAAADFSTIEYSTISDFSFNTGSIFVTNSVGYTNPIDVSNLGLLPLLSAPVYFRVFNSCSISGTSSYSNTISASCQIAPPPPVSPFTVRLRNSMIGSNNILYYTDNGIEYALFGGTTTNLTISTLSSLDISFRTLFSDNEVYTVIASGSSPTFNGQVTTTLIDNTPTFFGDIVNQSVNSYTSNLYYNSEGTPDALINVDRTLWSGIGLIEINFTSFIPPDAVNPWYYLNPDPEVFIGGGGGISP
jgi:hypothetical protein